MRLPRIGITALLTLVATLTISNFPLIQNQKSKIKNYWVLAQTPDTQLKKSLEEGNGSNDANKVLVVETQASFYNRLIQTLIVQNKTATALEIVERGRAKAFVELLSKHSSSNRRGQNVALRQSAPNSPIVEDIKRIAKEHQATLVSYSIIYDTVPVQGKQQFRKDASSADYSSSH